MKRFLKSLYTYTWLEFSRNILFLRNFLGFTKLQRSGKQRFAVKWRDRYPVLSENTSGTAFDAHYIYHPAWAARIIADLHPDVHVDISSTLTFCTMLSAFIPVNFFDYRPANLNLTNLVSERADLLKLPFPDNSLTSLSCMHVVEHIGLGRYGDQLDPDGDLKAIAELKRVLKPGGSLFFVTPVGKPRIQFNAHRVYSYEQIAEYFSGFEIKQFALVDDTAQFTINPKVQVVSQQKYGCGCWWFIKR